ncbi:MAG TPA: hypothetical protein VF329_03425 [Gammaproteobacteria bacterium]
MALEDHLTGPVVRPVFWGLLDIAGAPLRGYTGPGAFAPVGTGDPDMDGFVFVEAEGAVDVSDISEDLGIGGPVTVTFSAGELDGTEGVVQQLIADRRAFLGRKMKIWLGFLTDDESAVASDFEVIFNGVMVAAESKRQEGQPAVISVTGDADLQKANAPPVRWIDHQVFEPGDTASTFINSLSRGGIASAREGQAFQTERERQALLNLEPWRQV